MKTKIKWLLLSIILSITSINTASAYERTFDGTERVFFKNIKPSGWGDCWICASRTGWVHFWRSGYANTSDVKLTLVSGTEGAEGAIYVCTPAAGTYTDVTIVRSSTSATMTWSEKSKDISVGSDASLNFINNLSPSDWGTNYGHWAKYAPTPSVVGSMNGWKAEANPATSSRYSSSDKVQIIPVELSASTNYTFLIADGENQYGKSSLTITGATKDGSWEQYSTGDNKTVTLTTGEAGTYYFQYNTASKYVAVYYPKSHIAKNKVLYFDARNSTHEHWTGDFHVKYVYKYYDSGSNLSSGAEQYGETKLEDGVFYTTVPNVDHVGQVQLVSVYSNNHGSQKAYSNNGYGTGRSSSKQNCLMIKAENANWDITWEPGWQTYCPPMSSASISDNSTAVISWTSGTGTSENPYLVPSTGTIKVSASATSAVDDDNMTKKYDFKVNTGSGASSAQSGNSSTFNKTSLGNNTTYEISLDVWNNYNSTDGTKYTSATHKWYKALDVYTVSHSLTNMTTASGRTGSEAAAYGIAYTATFNQVSGYNRPASVTVMRGSTNITANCTWNQSTGELTIPAAQVSGNITITVAGEAQEYDIIYKDKDNADFTGTQAGAPTTHTYGSPTDLIMPTREHYEFAGWFTASNCASGQIGNTTAAQIGATAFTGDITLYAKWTEITHTVSFANDGHGTTTPNSNQTVGEATGVAINASNSTGYSFNTWTITSGSGSFASSASTASNTFYPAEDATLTASFNVKTYTATDNISKNGGDTDGQYTATYGESSIVINTEPTKEGYEVEGYYRYAEGNNKIANVNGSLVSGLDGVISSGKWIYDDDDLILYPQWTEKTYTLTLDANIPSSTTGTAGTGSFTAKYNTNTYGSISSYPTAVGYTFAGYYTNDATPVMIIDGDGNKNTGTSYIDGSANWKYAGNLTLYAHWTANPYTITLNNEAATTAGDASISVTFDASTNLTGTPAITKPAKTGYTFGGYYTEVAGGGVQLIDAAGNVNAQAGGDDTYTNSSKQWKYAGSIDLYAKWTQTINFDQNSATVDGTTSLAATYHTTLSTGSIENPKRIGYAFAGWATAADGSVVIATDGTVNSVDGYTDGSKNWVHAGESTLYAKWTADVKTFTGNGDGAASVIWNNPDNWSDGIVPTNDYSEVHIERGVNIGEDEVYHVGKIVITPNHTLTLINGGVLEVAGTITRPNDEPTETYEISLSSTGSKQSALIFDNTAGTTKASVSLWTSAKYNPVTAGYSFQYVAVPMTMVNVSDAFSGQNVYTYVWNEGSGWERRNYYYSLCGFEAVGVTSKDGMVAHTTGTLVSTANIVNRPLAYTSGDGAGMNMIGNSWTAPIKISEMEITGNAESTVYVYNSSTGSWVGNPTAVSGDAIVPAMQAYLIKATSGGGSLSIDYDKAVRGVAASDRTALLFAPKRDASSAGISEIRMRVSDDEDFYSVLRLFENEQFTDEFDNGWEARYIAGEGFAGQLYAQTDDKMTVLATPDLEGQVVGFIPGVASSYTISFEGDGEGYYLNDLDEQESTLIEEGNTYVFTPNESTNSTRFVISKMPIHKITTGTDVIYDGVKARKQMIDGILYIIRDGRIYDATGALVK